jgi:hypothetical protein
MYRLGSSGASQVPDASLHTSHALCGPRQTLGALTIFALSVLASRPLTRSPSALLLVTRLYQASGSAVFPVGYVFPCVRFTYVVRFSAESFLSLVALARFPSRALGYRAVCPLCPRLPLSPVSPLLHSCNTRYGWGVSPFPMGTPVGTP